jgi:AraC family transcriptional activator of tynA and feaB
MKRIFSTLNIHPRDRFDFWHSIACATIVGHDSIPAQPSLFSANIDVGPLTEIDVVRFENSPMRVSRTAAQVAKACSDELFVCRQDSGSLSIDQDGHAVTLRAGELSLLDPRCPTQPTSRSGRRRCGDAIPKMGLLVFRDLTKRY